MSLKKTAKSMLFRFPKSWIDSFYRIYNIVFYPEMKEKKRSYGSLNPDKTFYVIRPRTDCIEGLMSLFINVLRQISYAEKKGYIPVVDFENYDTQYKDESLKEKNVWNYYFTQPSDYDLKEVYKSKNVVLSGLNSYYKCYEFLNRDFNKISLQRAHTFLQRYVDFSNAIKILLKEELNIFRPQNSIGLYLRGTDYIALKPAGEPIQPTPKEAFKVVDSLLKKYSLKKVFIVTEDANYYKAAREYYNSALCKVSFDSFIKDYSGIDFLSKDSSVSQLASDPYERGAQYLIKLILLSQCRAIVGGKTCGSWMACVMAEENVEKYIFEKGIY